MSCVGWGRGCRVRGLWCQSRVLAGVSERSYECGRWFMLCGGGTILVGVLSVWFVGGSWLGIKTG